MITSHDEAPIPSDDREEDTDYYSEAETVQADNMERLGCSVEKEESRERGKAAWSKFKAEETRRRGDVETKGILGGGNAAFRWQATSYQDKRWAQAKAKATGDMALGETWEPKSIPATSQGTLHRPCNRRRQRR